MSSFMSLFGKGKNTLAIARSLYFNGKAQAELPHWYHKGLIANDFRARQVRAMCVSCVTRNGKYHLHLL